MEFRRIVPNSSSASHRRGIQSAESYVYLSDRATGIGRSWLDLSRSCLARMELLGERAALDRTSRDSESKNATDERPRELSKSARVSDTTRRSRPDPTPPL